MIFTNHYNMLICCFAIIINVENMFCYVLLWHIFMETIFAFIQDFFFFFFDINLCNIINGFTVTFGQSNISLLMKNIYIKKEYWFNLRCKILKHLNASLLCLLFIYSFEWMSFRNSTMHFHVIDWRVKNVLRSEMFRKDLERTFHPSQFYSIQLDSFQMCLYSMAISVGVNLRLH